MTRTRGMQHGPVAGLAVTGLLLVPGCAQDEPVRPAPPPENLTRYPDHQLSAGELSALIPGESDLSMPLVVEEEGRPESIELEYEDVGLGDASFEHFEEELEQARIAVGTVEGAQECAAAWEQWTEDLTAMAQERESLWEEGMRSNDVLVAYSLPGAQGNDVIIDFWAESGGPWAAGYQSVDNTEAWNSWALACYPFQAALEGNTSTIEVTQDGPVSGLTEVVDDGAEGTALVMLYMPLPGVPTHVEIFATSDHADDLDLLMEAATEMIQHAEAALREAG
ncbi:hypothetical protein [Nesterenkonia alkaliphila]|uniref:Uncharacterized protein n=1 Tax=Nesterenkonia alkaliphila TaxID=1463631 RepID=A0A7K1UK51_9MICC|nr:hypothetical protein [Nesterenkonia alkaliphila]MVT26868.1 hypothetical protein [Nesterenkonia alkaliphila]